MRALASLILVAPLLVAYTDHSTTPPGTVVDRGRRSVVVREDVSGNEIRHTTSKAVSRRCQVNERWPDCT